MKLQLIRHAKTAGNEKKEYIGVTDEPLSQNGIFELEGYIARGAYAPAELVFTSPLRRCVKSAELIFPKAPKVAVPDLAECDFGEFEGKSYVELRHRSDYGAFIATGRAPGGEEPAAFRERCCRAFALIVGELFERGCENGAVVAHGGTIMAVMERFYKEKTGFYLWQVPNCGGLMLTVDEKLWREESAVIFEGKIPPGEIDGKEP